MSTLWNRGRRAPLAIVWILAAAVAVSGCTGRYALTRRDTAGLEGPAWFSPVLLSDQATLARWSAAVGPPAIRNFRTQVVSEIDTLCVISWNMALGAGDLRGLVDDLRRTRGDVPLVLLLQEVYRAGPEVPAPDRLRIRFASKLGGDRARQEVEAMAETLGLNLYYVPSMRNGGPGDSDEDRGNAILSSLPLEELAAIELPFERQRRVALAATITGKTSKGRPWQLRVVSAHLDNLAGPGRAWIVGGEYARLRQARALVEHVGPDDAVILGGDFNTWFGFQELTYSALARVFPDTHVEDRRATFAGLLRLDHLFFRLPDGWTAAFRRADARYGSDHYPLVGTVAFP